jgi:hypothetical protein
MLQMYKILYKLSVLFPLLPLVITLHRGHEQLELRQPSLFAMLDLLLLLTTVSDLIHKTAMPEAMLRVIDRCCGGDDKVDDSPHLELAMEIVLLKLLIRACTGQRTQIENYCARYVQMRQPGQYYGETADTTVCYGNGNGNAEVRENSLYVNVMLNLRHIHGTYKALLCKRLSKDVLY